MLIAIKWHLDLMALFALFIILGLSVMYIGTLVPEPKDQTFLYIFGGLFAGFPFLMAVFTLPSSFMYYYEKELIKKYGTQTQGTLVKKYAEDQGVENPHTIYFFDYKFAHQGLEYNATAVVDSEKRYNHLKVGDAVKVKFLRYKPSQSSLVKTRLKS